MVQSMSLKRWDNKVRRGAATAAREPGDVLMSHRL